jgi:hypothetical protein
MEKKKESFLVKIYIVLFFFMGIALWFSVHASNSELNIAAAMELDTKINDILFSQGISQSAIVKQYGQDVNIDGVKWTKYYKTVNIKDVAVLENIETLFRKTARQFNLGLEKKNGQGGGAAYRFYSAKHGDYSLITFRIEPPPEPPVKKVSRKNKRAKK